MAIWSPLRTPFNGRKNVSRCAAKAALPASPGRALPSARNQSLRRLLAGTARLDGILDVGRPRADVQLSAAGRMHVDSDRSRGRRTLLRRHVADRVAAADVARDPLERGRHLLEL